MSEEVFVRQCSPTLAGLKTGSLFTSRYGSRGESMAQVRRWNQALKPKGVRVLPLRYADGRVLLYVFRPARLQGDLTAAQELLSEVGYRSDRADSCLLELMRRLNSGKEFPHEIGLFLGYPPENVRGFMEHRECKLVGCWKVYGDEAAARQRFEEYRRCTEIYCEIHANGCSIEQLTVKG